MKEASRAAAAAIPVRRRYTGWERAKANHASSHRKTRSGLMARHSSMTLSTSYTTPSKVQLVRVTIFTS